MNKPRLKVKMPSGQPAAQEDLFATTWKTTSWKTRN